jgi:hypothetical protein
MSIERVGGMMWMRGMGGMERPDADEIADRMISKRDEDGDGALSTEELGKLGDKMIEADSDGDGLISRDELLSKVTERLENMMMRGPMRRAGGMMWMRGMGGMERPDADEIADRMISKRDEDGDGALSTEELGKLGDKLVDADSDGDGLISQEELLARISEKMAEISTNQNEATYETQSASDLVSQLVSQLKLSEEETESFLEMLKDYGVDVTI